MSALRITATLCVILAFGLAVACQGEPAPFVPGLSPTVTPSYNPQGTPTAPIVISDDLPAGWRWQYGGDLPNLGMREAWLLIDTDSRIVLAIHKSNNRCWMAASSKSDNRCRSEREIGAYALKLATDD